MCHASAALVGALGITPLDFLLPLAMYIFLRKPVLWKKILAWILLIFYVIVMILGAVAAIRGIVLDASKHCCKSCCMRFSTSCGPCSLRAMAYGHSSGLPLWEAPVMIAEKRKLFLFFVMIIAGVCHITSTACMVA